MIMVSITPEKAAQSQFSSTDCLPPKIHISVISLDSSDIITVITPPCLDCPVLNSHLHPDVEKHIRSGSLNQEFGVLTLSKVFVFKRRQQRLTKMKVCYDGSTGFHRIFDDEIAGFNYCDILGLSQPVGSLL